MSRLVHLPSLGDYVTAIGHLLSVLGSMRRTERARNRSPMLARFFARVPNSEQELLGGCPWKWASRRVTVAGGSALAISN